MANQLNEFDRLIKESYENHEVSFNPQHWEELEEELTVVSPSWSVYLQSMLYGVALTGLVFTAMLIFTPDSPGDHGIADNPPAEVLEESSRESAPEELHEIPADRDTVMENERSSSTDQTKVDRKDQSPALAASDLKTKKKDANIKSKTIGSEKVASISGKTEPATEDVTGIHSGCTGMNIQFNAPDNYAKDAKFLWNFGDGYFSNDADPNHTFTKEGVFDVSLSVTSYTTGQISSNIVQAMIEVAETPEADFKFELGDADHLKIANNSYGATRIQWTLDGEEISAEPRINISIADNTKHELQLTAFNNTGCTDTMEKDIIISPAGNEFPKAYTTTAPTPYSPGAIIDSGEVMEFRVYRAESGEEVFSSSGSKGWTADDSEGNPMEKGEYKWMMMVEDDTNIRIYRGDVTLR